MMLIKLFFVLILIFVNCSSKSKESSNSNVIAICADRNFFTKTCKYIEKDPNSGNLNLISLSQNDKPLRRKNGFIQFGFFSKIDFLEAKKKATEMCNEAYRGLEYIELTSTIKFGITTEGIVDFWCYTDEDPNIKNTKENFKKYDLKTE